MRKPIPAFVQHLGASPTDWIEQDDRLPEIEQSFSYYERNQQDWWKQNNKIRKLFINIEKEINSIIKTNKIPSVLLLSWSQLSRKLSCDRATLKHTRRYQWVNAHRNRLLALITEANKQAQLITQPVIPVVSEIQQLKESLCDQRTQTALWYSKYLELEEHIDILKRTLAKRDEKLKALSTPKLSVPNTYKTDENGTVI